MSLRARLKTRRQLILGEGRGGGKRKRRETKRTRDYDKCEKVTTEKKLNIDADINFTAIIGVILGTAFN